MEITPDDIIEHWFGELGEDGTASAEVQARWWKKDPAYDDWLRERFGGALQAMSRGELDGWRATARGCLGMILLADQIARNVHRGSCEMYANDELSLRLSRELCESGRLEELPPMHRYFAIMPLMHAEDVGAQRECVAQFQALADQHEGALGESFCAGVDFAQRHLEIVERFGRFPHRNGLLGRDTTPEEAEFLTQPGSSF